MSQDPQSVTFRARVAGKWQLPLLLLSTFLLATTVVSLRPRPAQLSVEELVEQIKSFNRGLLLPEAEGLARAILQDDRFEAGELGPIYVALAGVLYHANSFKTNPTANDWINILAKYAQAEISGHALDGDALQLQGQVYEKLGQPRNALERYNLSLQRQPADALMVRKQALALQLQAKLAPLLDLHVGLMSLIEDASERPEILAWAVEQEVQLLVDENRLLEAEQIISASRIHFDNTPEAHSLDFLGALVQYKSKNFDAAELALRDLRNKLKVRNEIHAQSGWLLGKIIMADDGPQRPLEAISFFQDVLSSHSTGEYVAASKLGMAEALTDLQRSAEALGYYRAVLDDLNSIPQTRLIDSQTVRSSLTIHSHLLNETEQQEEALEYLQLASDLVGLDDREARAFYLNDLALLKRGLAARYRDQVGQADELSEEQRSLRLQRSRELYLSAAEDYLELSRRKTMDEPQAAEALWQAASMYDQAGQRDWTIQLLEGFLTSRPTSSQVPLALFRVGQAYQADGKLEQAVERYQQCIRDYRRTTPAQRSYIPLADCFVMLGSEYSEKAEDTLLYVLEEAPNEPNMFTPESVVYRDALFKLGDLYSRDGRYENAIERFDEALQRYPDDSRQVRATFLLADAYRHSSLELESLALEESSALRREELNGMKRSRLRKAEALFGQVIDRLSRETADDLSPVQNLQLQLSYTYQADCAFDLNEHERALDLYEDVVHVYQAEPVALTAYLQIINCYEILGRTDEILPALQRAQWLTGKIESSKFEVQLIRNKPDEWRKLFTWVADTGDYDQSAPRGTQ